MESKDRRTVLGSLAALLAAPLLVGRDTLVRAFVRKAEPVPPKINPPAHSVKRRG